MFEKNHDYGANMETSVTTGDDLKTTIRIGDLDYPIDW